MGNNKSIAIIRVVTGLGDMIMARPAIIGSIKARPKAEHVLYCMSHTAPIVKDIEGLRTIVVPGEHVSSRMASVEKILKPKDYLAVYNLNQCCLHYEVSRQPNVDRGRAEIFCDELDVKFDMDNYNVKFTDEEMDFAHTFMKKYWYYPYHGIGIHIRPSMVWREYPYMKWLIEHIARRLDGYVITVDDKYEYSGRYKNIVSLANTSVRESWVCMSMMDAGIGVDSFGCHAWASTGVSTYGIFGPTDPKLFLKYPAKIGWHSLTKLCPLGQRCWYKPCSIKEGKEPERPPRCLSCIWPPSIWRDAVQKLDLQHMVKHKYVPKKPVLAIQSSLAEYIDLSSVTNIQKVNNDDVALLLLEGLGGTMSAADHAAKIYKASGKQTHLFIRKHPELFRGNPYISDVECVGAGEHSDYLDYILKSFDAVAVIKTGLGKWYHQNGVMFEQDYERWRELYEQLPLGTNTLEKYKLNFIQTANWSLGLRFNTIESFVYDREKYEGLSQRYIVVSNGVDTDHKGGTQTKSWPNEYWSELVNYFDISVVQVGTDYDKRIKGTVDLRSKTSVSQLLGVLGDATAVVCQEGGLMHLSYAVGQRNVFVLRGPTQGNFYRYPGHHCIDSVDCGGCYWQTMLWWRDCPRNIDAECMKSIHPDYVATVVKTEMKRTGAY